MFCPKCGRPNPDDYNFCPQCGTDLRPARANAGLPVTPPVADTPDTGVEARVEGVEVDRLAGIGDAELEKVLRARLFTEGVPKTRQDLEQWMAFCMERNRRPELTGARLAGLKLERIELVGVDLHMADMRGADLKGANLSLTNLRGVNLSRASLFLANLQAVDLGNANLSDADLQLANLTGANLRQADLRGANLRRCKLQGANLQGADLQDASVIADLSENTILPDGSHWAPGTDLSRFTDPAHPHFWRADLAAPAYPEP